MEEFCTLIFTLAFFTNFRISTGECETPLLDDSVLKATSEASADRGAVKARLNSQVAWTAMNSDFSQYLTVDLKEMKNITSIATQGRPFSSEFVQEYHLEYGNNGLDFSEYKDTEGNIKIFIGNKDGSTIQQNYFETPIIARYVRINPTRWRDRISLRVELYGCTYVAETMSFDGKSLVKMNLRHRPIMSVKDHIRLRFRTSLADGILIYGQGSQGDIFALQLLQNQLVLNIDLGAKLPTSISVGSLLDDDLWHDVSILRNRQDLIFTVDRVIIKKRIRGEFPQLDLNQELFVGGVLNFNQEGLMVTQNFTGCIENLFINHTNFIEELKASNDDHFWRIGTLYGCSKSHVIPITFKSVESHLKLKGYEGVPNANVSLDFRTFDEDGLLISHKFHTSGSVQLYLQKGKIKLILNPKDTDKIEIDAFDEIFNDGRWHKVMLIITSDYVEVNIDGRPSKTKKKLSITTGSDYLIGGGVFGVRGFVGCMRYISIDGNQINPNDHKKYAQKEGGLAFDSCQMIDKCNPNPCEHGGICHQTWETFTCECGNTGYAGAVCHTSLYPLSCEAHRQMDIHSKKIDTMIDVDGSGELEPFPVTCEFPAEHRALTHLGHKNEKTTTVNGFDKAGSFVQDITYNAEMPQIVEFVNRSLACQQHITYECYKARLFNSPVPDNSPFKPFSWWVSRTNQMMDYWGGSTPGSRKCECGLYGLCNEDRYWCNCDSYKDAWLSDKGFLKDKDYLPVRQLRFGDTGTPMDDKQGRYTLGKLVCEGDSLFDNVVTFRLEDATIDLPRFDWGHSADIYFQFKTTAVTGVLIHSRGPTDYIKVNLVGGDQLQFSYFAGNGLLSVSMETLSKLNDNNWHSVLVERNRKEARIVIDGSLRKEILEPAGSVRAIHLTSDLVIGATVERKEGFVGCIRALMLNGKPVDLRGRAERKLYGVLPGCIGKCDSSPCLNNGTCLELYRDYDCDCRYTAFKGKICADEIGVNMRSDFMIKYDFEGTYKSTVAEKIRVGFTTTEQKGMLLGLYGYSKEYINLMMSSNGNLKLVFDFGFERQEEFYSGKNLADGQMHDIKISREDQGLTLIMKVDNYEPQVWKYKIEGSQDAQFNNIKNLYIGRNETMGKGDGFVGCISRVEFDDVYPLKLLFQEERPNNIHADPNNIQEDFCGVEPVTYPPEPSETRPPVYVEYETSWYNGDGPQPADSAVLGGILAVIFLALVAMAILIGRYVSRHKGEYHTHEDTGARDAPDADTAIVQGQTGHDVTKKKEWFI